MCTLHLVQQLGCIVLVKVAPQKIIDLHKKNLGCSFNEITILRDENVCVRGSINNLDEILK